MIYEYRCEFCEESFVGKNSLNKYNEPKECPICGKHSPRIFSAPHFAYLKMGVSGDMQTSADKWADIHEKEGKKEESPNLKHV